MVVAGDAPKKITRSEVRVLGPGDAYYFESKLPHRFRNVGDGEAVLVSASTPPTF